MSFFRDFSASATVAGFVTVLVGFTSSAVIVFQFDGLHLELTRPVFTAPICAGREAHEDPARHYASSRCAHNQI
jgi:predicted benzoate:H+ symporter BenE